MSVTGDLVLELFSERFSCFFGGEGGKYKYVQVQRNFRLSEIYGVVLCFDALFIAVRFTTGPGGNIRGMLHTECILVSYTARSFQVGKGVLSLCRG